MFAACARRPRFEPPVRYFVMGANRWATAVDWPPLARPATYRLTPASPGRAGGLVGGTDPVVGPSAAARAGPGTVSQLVSDPDNPVHNSFDGAGAHDYRALAERPDVLTFDSAPLDEDTEVTGPIRAELFVSCDCRDTDIWARLLDVAPDGTAFNLMSPGLDVLRASYRDPSKGRQLLEPGRIYALPLDHLVTSNVFMRGHRIRLQISTTFFPNFSRNLHTGDMETVSARRQKATVSAFIMTAPIIHSWCCPYETRRARRATRRARRETRRARRETRRARRATRRARRATRRARRAHEGHEMRYEEHDESTQIAKEVARWLAGVVKLLPLALLLAACQPASPPRLPGRPRISSSSTGASSPLTRLARPPRLSRFAGTPFSAWGRRPRSWRSAALRRACSMRAEVPCCPVSTMPTCTSSPEGSRSATWIWPD